MHNSKKKIFRNSLIIIFFTILDKLLFFIINIIVARYLPLDMFGEYTTALAYATFFSIFSDIGINQTLIRAINVEKKTLNEHFSNAIILKTILFFIVYLILILSLYFTHYNTNTIYLILIFGVVRIGSEYLRVFYALTDALEKFILSVFVNSLFSISLLLGVFLVIFFQGSYFHLAFIRMATVILFISICLYIALRKFPIKFNLSSSIHFIKNSFSFAASIILGNAHKQFSVLLISFVVGTFYTGVFNNAFFFITTLTFIPRSFDRVLLPYLYKIKISNNLSKFKMIFNFYSKFYAIGAFYIFILLYLYSYNIITIIFTSKYNDSIPILKILSFAVPFIFIPTDIVLKGIDKQKINTYINAIALVINFVAIIILIKPFGIKGVGFACVLTFFSIYLLGYLYLIKVNIVSFVEILTNFVLLSFVSFILILFQHFFLIKYNFIISAIIVSILYLIYVLVFLVDRSDVYILKSALGIYKKPSK